MLKRFWLWLGRLLGKVETSLELVQTSEEADAKDVY